MDKDLSIILSLSIAIPSLLALGRISHIQKTFLPFVICLFLGLLNELSVALIFRKTSTAINNNIYVLLEFPLYCWLFLNWLPGQQSRQLFFLGTCLGVIAWVVENLGFGYIYGISSYYRIFYSFTLVLLAINYINWLLVNERKLVLYNASFLICSGIIILFSYKVLLEVFYLYAPREAGKQIYSIHAYINLFQNLIYALAVLCIPKRIYSARLIS